MLYNFCFKKYKTIIELSVSFAIFLPLVLFDGLSVKFDFFGVVYSLLAFIIIIELVRMVGEYIFKNHVELRIVFDTFIIFMTRELILIFSNKEILLEQKFVYVLLDILILSFLFYFRKKAIETRPGDYYYS